MLLEKKLIRIGLFPLCFDPLLIHRPVHGRYCKYMTVRGNLDTLKLFIVKNDFKKLTTATLDSCFDRLILPLPIHLDHCMCPDTVS